MSTASLIVSLLFGFTGMLVIGFVVRSFVNAIAGPRKGWAERWKFRQREKQLPNIDRQIELGDWQSAFNSLKGVFFFEPVKSDLDLSEHIATLHYNILSRLASIAQSRSRQAGELVVLEDLISSRATIMRSWCEVLTNRNSLMRKRQKKMPDWAFEEYKKRLEELRDRLATNRRSIESQLDRFFVTLSGEQREDIVYH